MKKLSLLLTITLLSFSAHAATDFKSVDDATKNLSSYSVADIDGDAKRLKEKQELKIDQMFNALEETAKFLEKNTLTEDLAYQMERVSLITFIHDPTTFAVDLILLVYQKNKVLFEKAAQRLHPYDRNLLLETLKSKDEATSGGNG
jgi:hypothetical protein